MNALTLVAVRALVALTVPRQRDQRGDVPGWVLVTVMTAALWGMARDQLGSMLTTALNSVRG